MLMHHLHYMSCCMASTRWSYSTCSCTMPFTANFHGFHWMCISHLHYMACPSPQHAHIPWPYTTCWCHMFSTTCQCPPLQLKVTRLIEWNEVWLLATNNIYTYIILLNKNKTMWIIAFNRNALHVAFCIVFCLIGYVCPSLYLGCGESEEHN